MNPGNHLVVFVRAPRIGQVKTRLARDIGAVAAWGFYRRMLTRTIRPLTQDRRWLPWLAVTPVSTVSKRAALAPTAPGRVRKSRRSSETRST